MLRPASDEWTPTSSNQNRCSKRSVPPLALEKPRLNVKDAFDTLASDEPSRIELAVFARIRQRFGARIFCVPQFVAKPTVFVDKTRTRTKGQMSYSRVTQFRGKTPVWQTAQRIATLDPLLAIVVPTRVASPATR